MREIKFRAYIPTLKKVCFKGNGLTLNQMRRLGESYFREDIVWVEYTGLKDKNGVEIYEGDIVKWRDSLFIVNWDTPCALFVLKRIEGKDGMEEIPSHNLLKSEVIGNVYLNPELLKGEKI